MSLTTNEQQYCILEKPASDSAGNYRHISFHNCDWYGFPETYNTQSTHFIQGLSNDMESVEYVCCFNCAQFCFDLPHSSIIQYIRIFLS